MLQLLSLGVPKVAEVDHPLFSWGQKLSRPIIDWIEISSSFPGKAPLMLAILYHWLNIIFTSLANLLQYRRTDGHHGPLDQGLEGQYFYWWLNIDVDNSWAAHSMTRGHFIEEFWAETQFFIAKTANSQIRAMVLIPQDLCCSKN